MANAASDEPVRASHDGVTVEKTFEPDDFPVPAIAFTITSERDEAVSVRMADTIPEEIPTEDIGFHPKYGAEFWDVEGNTIVFTREFEPHEEYVTVYGLRGKDASDVERFLTEPEVTSVDEIDGASSDVVRDVIADDSAGPTEVDDDAAGSESDTPDGSDGDLDIDLPDPEAEAADESAAETTGSPEQSEPDEVGGADASDGPGPAAPPATEPAVPAGESVAAALVTEIEAGEVDDETMAELREALGVTADDSTDARIEHLQSTVADLEAYTDALEAFLDEEGDAQSVLRDVRTDFEAANERLEDLEAEVETLRDEVDEDLDEALEDVRDDVEALEVDLEDALEDRLDDVESDLESLEAELADVAEMRDRLASALGGLGGSGPDADDGGTDADSGDADDATGDSTGDGSEGEEADDGEELDLDG